MTAIPTSSAPSIAAAAPAPSRASNAAPTRTGGDDLLSAMNPAMDAAFAVGRPTGASGAAAILATTGDYVRGANATIDKLDAGIEARSEQVARLRLVDPEAADRAQAQVDLLQRLRDRIQLSVERVSRTAVGEGDDDGPTSADDDERELERLRRKREELELLEQRRALLASGVGGAAPVDSSMVARTYATGGATDPR